MKSIKTTSTRTGRQDYRKLLHEGKLYMGFAVYLNPLCMGISLASAAALILGEVICAILGCLEGTGDAASDADLRFIVGTVGQ